MTTAKDKLKTKKKKAKKKPKTKVKSKTKPTKLKKDKTKKKKYSDPNILEIVEKEIEITCPIRGKIKKTFKVKILKPVLVEQKQRVEPSDYVDKIDEDDSPIYGATEPEAEDDSEDS